MNGASGAPRRGGPKVHNQYTSEKKTIADLLSTTSPPIEVPSFQRNYSWEQSHVGWFWKDLIAFSEEYAGNHIANQEYFLGSIVLVSGQDRYLLLDGQQRLATATILLSVIRDYLALYPGHDGRRGQEAAIRVQNKYIADFDDATNTHRYTLTLNQYDREYFKRVVQEEQRPTTHLPEETMESHRLIHKAREFFQKQFEERYTSLGRESKAAFDWALRIRLVLTDHMSVVAVGAKDEENAEHVFETLNDRGIGLSTPDLLRNYLLRKVGLEQRDAVNDHWRILMEMEDDVKIEEFLRHYWLSHHGDVKTRALYQEIKATLTAENADCLLFSRDLQRVAYIYRDITVGRDDDAGIRHLLKGLNILGAKALYPAVLSAFEVGDLEQKKRLLRALVALYVRHNVIGNLDNSELETLVYEVAKELRATRDFNGAIQKLREKAPPDDYFVDQFRTAQIRKMTTAQYILRELELAKRLTEEVEIASPDRVHVEHIYPQTPLPGQKWPNHNVIVNRLGNLTLLSSRLNTTIRNGEFAAKKPSYQLSQLLLTKEVAELDHWDIEAINERQRRLSELALTIWRFPD